jgi:protein gp37
MSNIEWTDTVWNPVTGCAKVSEGCRNCYAFELHDRRHKAWKDGNWPNAPKQYHLPFKEVQLFSDRLDMPLKWKKPRRVFVNSMSDLFHHDVPDEFIERIFDVMWKNPQHIFQILTKRPERIAKLWPSLRGVWHLWPQNVWIGTSVESQQVIERIDYLMEVPAKVKFLSCEPLLGPLDDLRDYLRIENALQWIIVGGESGSNARPMHPDWARSIRDQCLAAGVPFFFKQIGEWARCNDLGIKGKQWHNFDPDTSVCKIGKKKAGRLLDGREWNEFPDGVQVIE